MGEMSIKSLWPQISERSGLATLERPPQLGEDDDPKESDASITNYETRDTLRMTRYFMLWLHAG